MSSLIGQGYNYVALDTEFPGSVVESRNGDYFSYQNVRANVNCTNLIQVAFSLFDARGRRPEGTSTFTFNFAFDENTELSNVDSMNLLRSVGIDFAQLKSFGIPQADFLQAMLSFGLVGPQAAHIVYITYHGAFDVAFFVKLVTRAPLPPDRQRFVNLLSSLFPCLVDLKVLAAKSHPRGGLEKLAADLGVSRTGLKHLSGSDARLTGETFFKIVRQPGMIELYRQSNLQIFGIR